MASTSVKLVVPALGLLALASLWIARNDAKGIAGVHTEEIPVPAAPQSSSAQQALRLEPQAPLREMPSVRSEREPLTEMDRENLLIDKLRKMDESLNMESVSPVWAAAVDKQISAVLQADSLKKLGAEPPDFYEADCRSSSCKLSLMFADASNADDTILALTTEIGAVFPEAVVVPVRGNDGTAQYFVYASTMKRSQLLSR